MKFLRNAQVFSLLAILALPLTAAPEGWLTDVDEAVAEAQASQRNILVDLYADWCGWCKVLERKVFSSPEFKAFAKDFVLLHVDVEDGGEGSEIQARYAASSLPTMLILDPKMIKIGSVDGYAPTQSYIGRLRLQLQEYQAFLNYYKQASQSDDLPTLKSVAQQLHKRGDGGRAAALYTKIRQRTESGTPGAAWLHYLLADAYRLDEDFERAAETLQRAQTLAVPVQDVELIERIDFLRVHIAQDLGDCRKARASLETFLAEHPSSPFTDQAMRQLDALKRGQGPKCT
jgi:thioredoxin-related protein